MQIRITEKTVTFEAILRVVTQFFLSDATGVMVDVVDEHVGAISSVLITKQSANDKIYVEVFDLFAELDLRSEEIVDSIITMFKYSGYQIVREHVA